MEKEKQFEIFLELLRRFQAAGVLRSVMLIGSWCLYFYRECLQKTESLPAVRTLDVDFLIPAFKELSSEINTPDILKEIGFVPTRSMNGITVYDHPELRVEFLVPELGRGSSKPVEIKKLHVNAQGLRYLNLIADHPRNFSYKGPEVIMPEPSAYAVNKLIISARRTKLEKHRKDLETAVGMLDYVYSVPQELNTLKTLLRKIPAKWRSTIRSLAEKHYPRLAQTIDGRG